MKFEEALNRLEKIVDEMERGDLSLDQALKKYEEGIKLMRLCTKVLEEAKKKIEIVARGSAGEVELKPFGPGEAGEKTGELF